MLTKSRPTPSCAILSAAAGTSTMIPTLEAARRVQRLSCSRAHASSSAVRHHREHHPDRRLPRDPADRRQLVAQQLRATPEHPDPALAQERVRLGRLRQERQRLVAADVPGPDRDRTPLQRLPRSPGRSRPARRPTAPSRRSPNSTSVRTSPLPSAPYDAAARASSTDPTFASTGDRVPVSRDRRGVSRRQGLRALGGPVLEQRAEPGGGALVRLDHEPVRVRVERDQLTRCHRLHRRCR